MRALILLALCVAAWAGTPSDLPSAASSDLEVELRGLKQDIMGFNTVRDKLTEAYRVISKVLALVSKMTAGSHKTAANELLARSAAVTEGVAACQGRLRRSHQGLQGSVGFTGHCCDWNR